MNPILRFLTAFAAYTCLMYALVLAVESGWYQLVYPLAAAASCGLVWCVICVFLAVGYDPD